MTDIELIANDPRGAEHARLFVEELRALGDAETAGVLGVAIEHRVEMDLRRLTLRDDPKKYWVVKAAARKMRREGRKDDARSLERGYLGLPV